jgi:hypothetical protein
MSTSFTANEAERVGDFWALGKVALRGNGQAMFRAHAGTGVLFLAGIAVASPLMAVGVALGAIHPGMWTHGLEDMIVLFQESNHFLFDVEGPRCI